jgi:hypothetical protein
VDHQQRQRKNFSTAQRAFDQRVSDHQDRSSRDQQRGDAEAEEERDTEQARRACEIRGCLAHCQVVQPPVGDG